jgi:hypothetical protein
MIQGKGVSLTKTQNEKYQLIMKRKDRFKCREHNY